MLTVEQIKSLKKGDRVLAEVEVTEICCKEFIEAVHPAYIDDKEELRYSGDNFHRSCLSLPPNKHNPCRKLKKGDKARVVERYGRTPVRFPDGKIKVGDIVTIAEDEGYNLFMYVVFKGSEKIAIPWFFLELVTPVEELEPYSVEESCGGANLPCFMLKRGEKHLSYYLYKAGYANHFYTREEAKAAAVAERDRLNAEYGKEQNHGQND